MIVPKSVNDVKKRRVDITLTPRCVDSLDEMARREGLSRSSMVEYLIRVGYSDWFSKTRSGRW